MLLIPCPWCGPRDEHEFSYGGEAHIARPSDPYALDDGQWADYLFMRKNPKGMHLERWMHAHGCRRWFNVARHTVTHQIAAVYKPGEKPPRGIESARVASAPARMLPTGMATPAAEPRGDRVRAGKPAAAGSGTDRPPAKKKAAGRTTATTTKVATGKKTAKKPAAKKAVTRKTTAKKTAARKKAAAGTRVARGKTPAAAVPAGADEKTAAGAPTAAPSRPAGDTEADAAAPGSTPATDSPVTPKPEDEK